MHIKKSGVIFWLVCLILAGCTPQKIAAPTAIQATKAVQLPTPLPSSTIAPTIQPTISITPTEVIPTSTSTPALPPDSIIQTHCLDIASQPPPGVHLSGSLIISDFKKLNLATGVISNLGEKYLNVFTGDFFTSPDGEWLAHISQDSKSGSYVIVFESASGKPKIRIPWLSKDYIGLIGWLDNKHLAVAHYLEDKFSSTLVINPFTGQRAEFFMDKLDGVPPWKEFLFHSSNIMPDPTLSLVVYPQLAKGGDLYIVLWDAKNKKVVTKVNELGNFHEDPMWSADGKDFVIAAVAHMTPDSNLSTGGYPIYEWFRVMRDGKVSQLTHFTYYFNDAETYISSRSPNGRYVAFLFGGTANNGNSFSQWLVLDVETQSVTNYCALNSPIDPPFPPVWSPDSRYFVVSNLDDFKGPVYIVDVIDNWAAQITKDTIPLTW